MRAALAALALTLLAACVHTDSSSDCDRPADLAHAAGREVTVCGTVARVMRVRRSRSGMHRVFLVTPAAGSTLEVDANLDVMGVLPVRPGDTVVVRGEYYDDGPGRSGIHWTHRTTRGTHPPGYVVLNGVTYQ